MQIRPFIIALLLPLFAVAQKEAPLITAATNFINSLDDSLRAKAIYKLSDDERMNWHYIPRTRQGVPFKSLNDKQREAGMALLKLSLSEKGLKKATDIMAMENVLRYLENRPDNDVYRDPSNYSLTIFGTPSNKEPWGWRVEGHHLSLNYTSATGFMDSATPTFFGSNPAIVPSGAAKGKVILKDEMDLGFDFVNKLSPDQLKIARVLEKAPGDIITASRHKVQPLKTEGISYKELNASQKKEFMQLLNVYVEKYPFGFSDKLMAKIKAAGIDNLYFTWMGGLKPGEGHYYRIQGPMLIIEYDNTQNDNNHIHTVVRDLTNDWGEDILREHYEKEHKN